MARWSIESQTPVGKLKHLKPTVQLSETPPHWARPSVPLGYNEPAWPARAYAASLGPDTDHRINRLLQDLRIVEFSAFVAAPLGGMTMAQFGAEVIRIDPIGGAIDHNRWPVTATGASLYWAGLNKANARSRWR